MKAACGEEGFCGPSYPNPGMVKALREGGKFSQSTVRRSNVVKAVREGKKRTGRHSGRDGVLFACGRRPGDGKSAAGGAAPAR